MTEQKKETPDAIELPDRNPFEDIKFEYDPNAARVQTVPREATDKAREIQHIFKKAREEAAYTISFLREDELRFMLSAFCLPDCREHEFLGKLSDFPEKQIALSMAIQAFEQKGLRIWLK